MKQGFVFLCNDITEPECLKRLLLGGKEKYANRVNGLQIGDRLVLYNYDSKKLHGIFEAVTEVTENIEADAWNGEFPVQVKMKVARKCKPLSRDDIVADGYLKENIKFDRNGRPTTRLSADTVAYLEKVFTSTKRVRVYEDGHRLRTKDGHYVRSKPEQKIDDWLYKHRIVHAYESDIPGAKRCDFEIPTIDGPIYIEYWGLTDAKYLKDKKHKQEIYHKHNLKLIELEPNDLKNLDRILGNALLNKSN